MSRIALLPMSSWPASRKAAAATLAMGCVVALACAAVYVSALAFLLLNKADPRQAHFWSIVH